MDKEQVENLFALLFVLGFALCFVFNHVNETLWWIGFIAMMISGMKLWLS